MAQILPLTPANIRRAALALRAGELVAFPTETVYGLGADATSDQATAAIFAAKGRPSFNPLITHLPNLEAARRIVELSPQAERLGAQFWPGALSMVAKRREDCGLSRLVSAGLPTAAVRVPAHDGARDLLRAAGVPIAAPSANPSGAISPTSAAHVAAAFGDQIAIILDGGPCTLGLESTVIDMSTETPALLRAGGVTLEALEAALDMRLEVAQSDDVAPRSPGQMHSHYAPSRPLRMNARSANPGEALLGFGPAEDCAFNLSPSGDVRAAAANLFHALHLLDKPPWTGIAVMPVPKEGLGRAINDRLRRAAAIPASPLPRSQT
jgi:L-threonylcarbamoyladenylate synthase